MKPLLALFAGIVLYRSRNLIALLFFMMIGFTWTWTSIQLNPCDHFPADHPRCASSQ